MKWFTQLASLTLIPAAATVARAADLPPPAPDIVTEAPSRFFARVGVAGLIMNESAGIYALGSKLPGATINIEPQVTTALELGYFFTPNIAVMVTGGIPPKAVIEGAGTIGPVGRLGSIIYGPTTATIQYHFTGFGQFQPYVGVGPAVLFVFSEKDGVAQNLRVDSSAGLVGQIGVNYMIDRHWGVFADVKAAWLGTQARGSLGPLPFRADVRLDPVAVSTGVVYKF